MGNMIYGHVNYVPSDEDNRNLQQAKEEQEQQMKEEAFRNKCKAIHAVVSSNIEETLAERGKRYGDFHQQSRIAQELKRVMMCTSNYDNLFSDQKEALEMIANKIGRILNGDPDYHDNWHDIQGYAKLVADRLEKQ